MKTYNKNFKSKKKGYTSLLLLLLSISLFVTATYAWFTDSAYSFNNEIMSGNMYVDIIATEEQIIMRNNIEHYENPIDVQAFVEQYNIDNPEGTIDENSQQVRDYVQGILVANGYDYNKYTRTYDSYDYDLDMNVTLTDTYYIITDKDANTINLYNVEPGSLNRVYIDYLNTGDLAFKTAGTLKIDVETKEDGTPKLDEDGNPVLKSYTGIETLNMQYLGETDRYNIKYSVIENDDGDNVIDPKDIRDSLDVLNGNEIKVNSQPSYDDDDDEVNHNYYEIEKRSINDYEYSDDNDFFRYTCDPDYVVLRDQYLTKFNNLKEKQAEIITRTKKGEVINKLEWVTNDGATFDGEVNNVRSVYYDLKDDFEDPEDEDNRIYYKDCGNHLEDVLEVYVPSNANPMPGQHIVFFGDQDAYERKTLLDKDNGNFFGTLKQFTYLMEYGPSAVKGYEIDESTTVEEINSRINHGVKVSPEEVYMSMYNSLDADLYGDYQRYLSKAGGYCLPVDVVTETTTGRQGQTITKVKDDVRVSIYGLNSYSMYSGVKMSEIGSTELVLYMPEDVDSTYENASISLSLGVTGTQVEYEMDGTECMIYDRDIATVPASSTYLNGEFIAIHSNESKKGIGSKGIFRVIDAKDDLVTLMYSDSLNDKLVYNESVLEDGYTSHVNYMGSDIKEYIDNALIDLLDTLDIDADCVVPQNYNQEQYKLTINRVAKKEDLPEVKPVPKVLESSIKSNILTITGEKEGLTGGITLEKDTESESFGTINGLLARPLAIRDVFNSLGTDSITISEFRKFVFGWPNSKSNQGAYIEMTQTINSPIYSTYFIDSFVNEDGGGRKKANEFGNYSYGALVATKDDSFSLDIGRFKRGYCDLTMVFTLDFSKLNESSIEKLGYYSKQYDVSTKTVNLAMFYNIFSPYDDIDPHEVDLDDLDPSSEYKINFEEYYNADKDLYNCYTGFYPSLGGNDYYNILLQNMVNSFSNYNNDSYIKSLSKDSNESLLPFAYIIQHNAFNSRDSYPSYIQKAIDQMIGKQSNYNINVVNIGVIPEETYIKNPKSGNYSYYIGSTNTQLVNKAIDYMMNNEELHPDEYEVENGDYMNVAVVCNENEYYDSMFNIIRNSPYFSGNSHTILKMYDYEKYTPDDFYWSDSNCGDVYYENTDIIICFEEDVYYEYCDYFDTILISPNSKLDNSDLTRINNACVHVDIPAIYQYLFNGVLRDIALNMPLDNYYLDINPIIDIRLSQKQEK